MRTTPILTLTFASLAGCSSAPGLEDPTLALKPMVFFYENIGKTRMQSPSGGGVQDNAAMDLDLFGMSERDTNVGGYLTYGDGFSGLEFFYQNVELGSTRRGTLTAAWGAIPLGTEVHSRFDMDEFKLSYRGQIFEYETEKEIRFRLALGASIVQRSGGFDAFETDAGTAFQNTNFEDDGAVYGAGRARIEYAGAALDADYALSPNLNFGGDFDGTMWDLEITGSYTLEGQDMTFLAGYRWSELPISGVQEGLLFEHDFRLQGYFLGLQFAF